MPFILTPELEALRAHDWYLERSLLAAAAFQEALESAGVAILDAPDRWVEYLYGTRRYLLTRFPFAIVYRSTETKIQIIAVAHGSRRPGYWSKRLSD